MAKSELAKIMDEIVSATPTADAIPDYIIHYIQKSGYHDIAVADPEAAEYLDSQGYKMVYDSASKVYKGRAIRLKKIQGIKWVKFQTQPVSDIGRAKVQKHYISLEQQRREVRKLQRELAAAEQDLVDMVVRHGIQRRFGATAESEIFLPKPKKRLQNQEVNTVVPNINAILALSKKYPKLKSCIKTQTIDIVDRVEFKKVLSSLPPKIQSILHMVAHHTSFVETALKNPECKHCGGKTKLDTCKRCILPAKKL